MESMYHSNYSIQVGQNYFKIISYKKCYYNNTFESLNLRDINF